MLGKLIKHEFKATGRILLPINILILLITFAGRIVLMIEQRVVPDDFTGLDIFMLSFYFIMIIAFAVITLIVLVHRFYKNLFTDEGYLSFTLPVSTMAHLNVKWLVAFTWNIISAVTFCLSILILIVDGEFISDMREILPYLSSAFADNSMTIGGFIGWIVFLCVLSCATAMLSFYLAIVIGQLFNRHRVAAAVIAYIVLYIINQIIGTVMLMLTSFSSLIGESAEMMADSTVVVNLYHNLFIQSAVLSVVLAVIYYIATYFIMSKKLNLE